MGFCYDRMFQVLHSGLAISRAHCALRQSLPAFGYQKLNESLHRLFKYPIGAFS